MSTYEPDGISKWTQVSIRLQSKDNSGIQFMKLRDKKGIFNPTDSSVAIMAEPENIEKFCHRQSIDKSSGDEIISFGVILPKEDTVSINIGIMVEDKNKAGYWIPIYIDPNIRNAG